MAGRVGPDTFQHYPNGARRGATHQGPWWRLDSRVNVLIAERTSSESGAVNRVARVGIGIGQDARH